MRDAIRVRFAPSPTGLLHIGNTRTALFNWLFARRYKGKFILRIEDTDLVRSSPESERSILEDLSWLGLKWDEGPDAGGKFGPYRQSERGNIYQRHAEELLRQGKAYQCFCRAEELEARRKEALAKGETPRYDNRCRKLTFEERKDFLKEGRKPALRFKVPKRTIKIHDIVRGEVVFDTESIGDFIILKSDGRATFNFAVVVDDALMKISHVIRGEDHLSNTPRHILLFEALDFPLPGFAHMSMTLGPDGGRLSKRHGATAINHFRQSGYLPEALVNYLALLGWSHPEEKELLSVDELLESFSLERLTKSASIFDLAKLNWVSNWHIRQAHLNRLYQLSKPFIDQAGLKIGKEPLKKIIEVLRAYIKMLSEIPGYLRDFLVEVKLEGEEKRLVENDDSQLIFKKLREKLAELSEFTTDNIKSVFIRLQEEIEIKGKRFYQPLRLALTGRSQGLELIEFMPALGKEKTIERLIRQIN